jgi:hypothetical protein
MTKNLRKGSYSLILVLGVIFLFLTSIGGSDENSEVQLKAPLLIAYPRSMTKIRIAWYPEDSNIDGFKLERSINDQLNYKEIANVEKKVNDYLDVGLKPGITYWYRVRAYNPTSESKYSNPESVTTPLSSNYVMCVNKTQGFPCLDGICSEDNDNTEYHVTNASEVFECLDLQLKVPSTMVVSFKVRTRSSSCYELPYFEVTTATDVQTFHIGCNVEGNGSISIKLGSNQKLDNLKFGLFSGDWGASIQINKITLTPTE